jgi:hypothetical protein
MNIFEEVRAARAERAKAEKAKNAKAFKQLRGLLAQTGLLLPDKTLAEGVHFVNEQDDPPTAVLDCGLKLNGFPDQITLEKFCPSCGQDVVLQQLYPFKLGEFYENHVLNAFTTALDSIEQAAPCNACHNQKEREENPPKPSFKSRTVTAEQVAETLSELVEEGYLPYPPYPLEGGTFLTVAMRRPPLGLFPF